MPGKKHFRRSECKRTTRARAHQGEGRTLQSLWQSSLRTRSPDRSEAAPSQRSPQGTLTARNARNANTIPSNTVFDVLFGAAGAAMLRTR